MTSSKIPSEYAKSIPASEPEGVRVIKSISSDAFNLWIDALDGKLSKEEIEAKAKEVADRIYYAQDKAKDAAAGGIAAAAAIVNVIPFWGQIASAVLAAVAALVKWVPVARSAPGPNFTWRESAEMVTYRGFTRYMLIAQKCKSTEAGQKEGKTIGGPGTPEYCNTGQFGGLTLKNEHVNKVNNTLINLGKYFGIPDILKYFPEGPAAKNPSFVGDRSPGLYLIEAFDGLPPFESLGQAELNKVKEKFFGAKTKELQNQNYTKLAMYAGVGVLVIWLIRKK